jgi:hypothetical protein
MDGADYRLRQPESDAIETTFELNDTLYAKAEIPPTDEVYLWLGANVMLSYPIGEAETLLDSKLQAAKRSLSNCEEDLDFLREQVTVTQPCLGHPGDLLISDRRWKWRLLGYTTGTLCKSAKIRKTRIRRKGKAPRGRPEAETCTSEEDARNNRSSSYRACGALLSTGFGLGDLQMNRDNDDLRGPNTISTPIKDNATRCFALRW